MEGKVDSLYSLRRIYVIKSVAKDGTVAQRNMRNLKKLVIEKEVKQIYCLYIFIVLVLDLLSVKNYV